MEDKDFVNFEKALFRLANLTRQSDLNTFTAFLEYAISLHSFTKVKDLSKATNEIKEAYFIAYKEYVMLQHHKIWNKHLEWFDAFGTYFELNTSTIGKQRKGQFFTPPSVCDFMVSINGVDKNSSKMTVYDPACGSSRLLLASHAFNPKNFHFGQDIDYICCLMSAVNMMMHGIRGEVVWGNALDPDSYFEGWAINPNIVKYKGIPNIENMLKEDSFIYKLSQQKKAERLEELKEQEKEAIEKLKQANIMEIDDKNKLDFGDTNEKTSFDFF